MKPEVIVTRPRFEDPDMPNAIIHHSEMPGMEGKFFMTLIERWGMVNAANYGEDTAGRTKVGEATVEHVIERAYAMTVQAFERMRSTDMMIQIPTVDEMEEVLRVRKEEKQQVIKDKMLAEEETTA